MNETKQDETLSIEDEQQEYGRLYYAKCMEAKAIYCKSSAFYTQNGTAGN